MKQRVFFSFWLFFVAMMWISSCSSNECSWDSDCSGNKVCVEGKCKDNSISPDANIQSDKEVYDHQPVVLSCQDGHKQLCFTDVPSKKNVGNCNAGVQECVGGQWGICVGEVVSQKEECNGKDDDCNGQIDDIPSSSIPLCRNQQGICLQSKKKCLQEKGWQECDATSFSAYPTYELVEKTCDNLDNDCNGQIDENLQQDCLSSHSSCIKTDSKIVCLGSCKSGIQKCNQGQWGLCEQEIFPVAEVCDGVDNNCDGLIDEKLTRSCFSGTTGCTELSGNYSCKGACLAGLQTCSQGVWSACQGEILPKQEDCGNGVDDDCNGSIDECAECKQNEKRSCYNSSDKGCETSNGLLSCKGSCKAGSQVCVAGKWSVCSGEVAGTTEVCNQKDDDCDGLVDEDAVCILNKEAYSGSLTSSTYHLQFLNAQIGFQVGLLGRISRTEDGGKSWTSVVSPTTRTLYKILTLSSGLVLVVGSGGTILRSVDYGKTFQTITTPTTYSLRAISSLSSSFFVVVGDRGTILFSEDGGETWALVDCQTQENFNDVASSSYWISVVGNNGTLLSLSKSKSCSTENSPTSNHIVSVTYSNSQFLAVAKGELLYSNSYGKSWYLGKSPATHNWTQILSPAPSTILLFSSSNTGSFFLSLDQGAHFVEKKHSQNKSFSNASILDSSRIVLLASSAFEKVESWANKEESFMATSTLRSVAFDDSGSNALAVGYSGTLLFSNNKGKTWQRKYLPGDGSFYDVAIDGGLALVVGSSQSFLSKDGGETWKEAVIGSGYFFAVHIASQEILVSGSSGKMYRSTDGGQNWKLIALPSTVASTTLYSISRKGSIAVAVGSFGKIIRSVDSGETWVEITHGLSTASFYSVKLYKGTGNLGLIAGSSGSILYSSNNGETWQLGNAGVSNSLYGAEIYFNKMFVVGTDGTFLSSTDGGKTWGSAVTTFLGYSTFYSIRRRYGSSEYCIAGEDRFLACSSNSTTSWTIYDRSSRKTKGTTSWTPSRYWWGGSDGMLIESKDSGVSFSSIPFPRNVEIRSILSDSQAGMAWVVGGQYLFTYTQSTDSWKEETFAPLYLNGLSFSGVAGDSVVFVGSSGNIFYASALGKALQSTLPVSNKSLEAVHCFQQKCIAVGFSGTIVISSDSGKTWVDASLPANHFLQGIAINSKQQAVVVGNEALFFSKDDGKTWKTSSLLTTGITFVATQFLKEEDAFLASDSLGRIWISGDGGENWSQVSVAFQQSISTIYLEKGKGFGLGSESLKVSFQP